MPIFTSLSEVQFSKADRPILVTKSGITMLMKPQPENASSPIDCKFSGSCSDFSAMQPLNTDDSMDFNELLNVTLVSAVQFSNADGPMAVIVFGITMLFRTVFALKALSLIAVTEKTESL